MTIVEDRVVFNRLIQNTYNQFMLNLPTKRDWALITRCFFVLLMIYTVLIMAWVGDDSQITFRQIWNFINGEGITFNYNVRVQAFTHPLWFLLLSYLSFFTKELFLTTILISLVLSILAVLVLLKIEINGKKDKLTILSPIYVLIFSWAFCDYTTSGLENPLSYLLVGLLFYYFSLQDWEKHLKSVYLILALLVLNRFDYALLFLPVALVLIPKTKNIRGFLTVVWPGALIIGLWIIFAMFYFGTPFPNTYFAKLNADYPIDEVINRGRKYFSTLRLDIVTIIIIFSGSILSYFSKNRIMIAFTVGVWAYIAYIYLIGGDFMQGRFFAVIVYLSMGQIVFILSKSQIWNEKVSSRAILVFFIITLHVGASKEFPFTSGIDYTARKTINQIFDERGFYYNLYGLFSKNRQNWPEIADHVDYIPGRYRTSCGFIGSYSLMNATYHLVDVCALTDPFLSRLPAVRINKWKTGHNLRKVPQEYGEFLIGKVDELPDEKLNDLLHDITLVTRGKLFSIDRFAAILRLNFGRHSNIDMREYKDPNLFIPITNAVEIIELDNWDQELDYENLPPIYEGKFRRFNGNLKFIVKNPSVENELHLYLDLDYEYDIYVNEEFLGKINYFDNIGNEYIRSPIFKFEKPKIVESVTIKSTKQYYEESPNFNALYYMELVHYR